MINHQTSTGEGRVCSISSSFIPRFELIPSPSWRVIVSSGFTAVWRRKNCSALLPKTSRRKVGCGRSLVICRNDANCCYGMLHVIHVFFRLWIETCFKKVTDWDTTPNFSWGVFVFLENFCSPFASWIPQRGMPAAFARKASMRGGTAELEREAGKTH